jgi:hypothetical protein
VLAPVKRSKGAKRACLKVEGGGVVVVDSNGVVTGSGAFALKTLYTRVTNVTSALAPGWRSSIGKKKRTGRILPHHPPPIFG